MQIQRVLVASVLCLLALPWLNPYTFGPMPSVVSWLVSAVCATVALVILTRMMDEVRTEPWQSLMVEAWIVAAVLSAAIALIQYFGISYLLSPWISTAAEGEAYGNLRQRNQFASLTNIGLSALIWNARKHGWCAREGFAYWPKLHIWILLLVFANAASASRTGMVQLAFVLMLYAAWRCKNRPVWKDAALVVAVVGYLVAGLLLAALAGAQTTGGGIMGRLHEAGAHCSSRSVLWSNVISLIGERPWFGWGLGELDYAHFVTLYPRERFCDILDNAHNLPLHLAVELGLPVACLLMTFFIWWLARNRPWAEKDPTRQMAWAVLAVIGLHSLLEYPLWYGPFQLAVGLCVLILWRTRPMASGAAVLRPSAWTSSFGSRTAGLVVSGVMLAALSAAAWDYWRVSQLYLLPSDRAAAYRDNTLEKVRDSWFFQDQVQFAELTTRTPTKHNAAQHYAQALQLLHFSPEPRVIEAVIESAVLLGQDQEALFYLQRYQAAFPEAHAAWAARSARYKTP